MGSLLAEIYRHGVSVTLVGELVEVCPLSNLPPDLLEQAKANKPQLIAEVQEDTPPPLTVRQLHKLNDWLDSVAETNSDDRQKVIDECTASQSKRDCYITTFKCWDKIRRNVQKAQR